MYRERASRVPGAFVWSSIATGDEVRVLPDGCMDFLWDGESISIAGADTHAQVFRAAPATVMTGLRFAPGYAPRVLGVPADEFTDQRVPLDAIWSTTAVERITAALTASPTPGEELETIALGTRPENDEHAALIDRVVALARVGSTSIAIADEVGLSTRQLQRRSTAAFGYGAKRLVRVLRMQQALDYVRRGTRLADSAARVGYADQSHLAREVKEMAGVTITQLLT
jgi:AraC-like DNA-binding protein